MRKELVNELVIYEINNFRRLSGLPLLNESGRTEIVRGIIKAIDDVIGITSKSVDTLSREYGSEAAKLLKKLADPNDTTPLIKIMDKLMKANKTVGRSVYTQIRNHLDTLVDTTTGKSLKEKLDLISDNSKKMIQDGSIIDDAIEYFETETLKILNASTDDKDLARTILKYEKDVNRDWFPSSEIPRAPSKKSGDADVTSSSKKSGEADVTSSSKAVDSTPPRLVDFSLDTLTKKMDDEEAQRIFKLFEEKSQNWTNIKSHTTNLLERVKHFFDKGKRLEEETLNLITVLNKFNKPEYFSRQKEIMEQINKNMSLIQDINSKTYKTLHSWMEKYMKQSNEKDIRLLYSDLSKEEGWGKVIAATPFWNRFLKGFGHGLIEFGKSSKNLTMAWFKLIVKPVTIPLSIINRVFVKSKDFELIGKLSKEEKIAFNNWLITSSPDAWGSASPVIQKLGLAGKIGYGSAQLLRRWLTLKFILGLSQAAIAGGLKFFNMDDTIQKYPLLKEFFTVKELREKGYKNFWANVFDNAKNTSYEFIIPMLSIGIVLFKDIPNLLDKKSWEEVKDEASNELSNMNISISGEDSSTTETATVEGAKEVAPEYIQNYIWEDENGNIYLAVGENDDFLITLENDVYMLHLPDEKIKLSDY